MATSLDVQQIKEVLLGLEYDLSGKHLTGLDLYERKKKTSWGAMAKGEEDRKMAGIRFRKELIKNFSLPPAANFCG